MTDKNEETAFTLIKQVWEIMQIQLEPAEKRRLTMGTFVCSENDTNINGFWKEHAMRN